MKTDENSMSVDEMKRGEYRIHVFIEKTKEL